jgi:hypothetical protein
MAHYHLIQQTRAARREVKAFYNFQILAVTIGAHKANVARVDSRLS